MPNMSTKLSARYGVEMLLKRIKEMHFVQGLPHGVYVGQTHIDHAKAIATEQTELTGFNLALHVQDDPQRVQQHRMILLDEFAQFGVNQMTWMTQTHSVTCHNLATHIPFTALEGDGAVTQNRGHALMMMTADCLPIVLGNQQGTEVANLHAGWRGLANGIVENTLAKMNTKASWAWLGAAISQPCFEVGEEVKTIFCEKYPDLKSAFEHGKVHGKYHADLYAIARYILKLHGVKTILGGEQCTYRQSQDYYSYRRNSKTGRMATFVFMG